MTNTFQDQVETRKFGVEGIETLIWPIGDVGAYGDPKDGPWHDWIRDSETFLSYVPRKDMVIQAGGNCGMYAALYSRHFEWVVSVEPEDLNYYCLKENTKNLDNVHLHKAALGAKIGRCNLRLGGRKNVGTHTVRWNEGGDVPVLTIDSIVEETDKLQYPPIVSLIHLDVEGSESEALEGALNTIRKHRPTVITERGRGTEHLFDLGYRLVYTGRMDNVFVADAV